ncbi:hypothetical protein AB3Y40_08740 [Yoonia sp. R2331]|uniref:hypothetical protein n=1 Tax=Yoonia sp. R2331 TaxID=3237238 RepID=UPI0034E52913
MNVLNSVRNAVHKRALYLRTKRELQMMPLDVALDLDIHREDAHLIASRAVYG